MTSKENPSAHEAVLMVLSDPGEAVGLDEFHEWYDEEHVPLRMSTLPQFLTGARYEAVDGKKDFAALYDVSSVGLFNSSRYTDLRTKRSAREAELFTRLGTIDRRTYRCLKDDRVSSFEHYQPFLITVELAQPSTELQAEMKALPGWKRTQLCELLDSSIVGRLQPPSTNPSCTTQTLLIFEFENQNYESSVHLQELLTLALSEAQIVVRKWKLYRGWKNSAR